MVAMTVAPLFFFTQFTGISGKIPKNTLGELRLRLWAFQVGSLENQNTGICHYYLAKKPVCFLVNHFYHDLGEWMHQFQLGKSFLFRIHEHKVTVMRKKINSAEASVDQDSKVVHEN